MPSLGATASFASVTPYGKYFATSSTVAVVPLTYCTVLPSANVTLDNGFATTEKLTFALLVA